MALAAELKKKIADAAGISVDQVSLEHPGELKNGDYSSGVALQHAKQLGKKPRELAEEIVAKLGAIEGVAKIEIAGAGFINFYLSSETLAATVQTALEEDMWGVGESYKGKTILMEYTDPNPFKEFHIGHLVPNAIGESISRLFQFSGANVVRSNYQGDVGVHVAKAMFILMEQGILNPTAKDLSTAYPEGSKRFEEDPQAKEQIDALNKKIYEKSDPRINDLYAKGRAVSLKHFEEIYRILDTKFDYYFFESETGPIGAEIVRKHIGDVFEESEGAIVFKGEKYDLHTRVFLNKMGLPTYEAKDLGLVELKREKVDFDFTMTITANEQADYFKVVMKAMELVFPDMTGRIAVRTHGLLRFAEGKMSSRTGNIIRGEDLIADLASAAKGRATESRAGDVGVLAQQIAVGAIKYQILKQASHKDIIFDRERALSLEGDSGPYLQYAHARAHAVVEKAQKENAKIMIYHNFENNVMQKDLARMLHRFPEVVEFAASINEPHALTSYLLEIASRFNSWYAQEQILDGTPAAAHKVALTDAVRKTLKNGLWILAIPAPDRM